MPLPAALRSLAPDALRHDARLRATAVGAGLIPPMPMHTAAEAELLSELAVGRHEAVEIGVFEGSSALVLVRALPLDATLNLVDSYTDSEALVADSERRLPRRRRARWRGIERAARRAVGREAKRRSGPRLNWHIASSEAVAQGWSKPVDFVFIDGDHSEPACRLDWELWSPLVVEGGVVVFHDAREGSADGDGGPGPTAVVNELFRGASPLEGWRLVAEVDTTVAVGRRGP